MGRVCNCCGCERPHEKFGGKGPRARICSDCRKLPLAERLRNLATGEIRGFLEQANISQKNIARLHSLASIDDAAFQELRTLILAIAQLTPRRRRRWERIASIDSNLMDRAIEAGFADEFSSAAEPDCSEIEQPDYEIPF